MSHLVRLLIALSFAAAACFSPAAYALDTGDIVVTSIKGEVHVTVNGAERALKPGGVLDTPSSIRTGSNGTIELKQGATTVSVGPDTLLEFPAQEKRGGPIDRVVQPRGNAFYSIGKRAGRKLRVETPYLVGVIKGTQFNVAAQGDSTTISLFEGRLEVHASDESDVVDLDAGEIATRKRGAKSITVMKMDGKVPTTAPRPSSGGTGGGSGDIGAPRSPGSHPVRGAGGDSLLARDARSRPEIVGPDADNAAASAAAGLDVRGNAVDVDANADVRIADKGANFDAAVNLGANADANSSSNLNVATPAAGIDAGVAVNAGPGGVDTSVNVNVAAPAVSLDVGAGVNVGNTGVAVDVGARVDVAPLGTDVATSTSLNLAPGAADVTTNTSIDVGPVAADVGANVGAAAGTAGLAVDTQTVTAVDAGPIAADLGTNAAVDAGTSGVSTTVDVGVGAALGTTPVVDTLTSVTADVGTTTAAAVDTTTSVAGVDTGVAAAVNGTAGTVDLGVNVAGVNVDAGVDLGLDANTSTTTTTTTTPVTTPTAPVVDVGGLIDGLLRRKK
jgi:hypothetical protein